MGARRSKTWGFWVYFWVYVVLLYVPLVTLAVFSFNNSLILSLPWRGFSVRWYAAIGDSPALLTSLRTSIIVATVSSIFAVVLGGAVGVAVTRFRFPGRGALLIAALAPLVIPFLGLAVALLLTLLAVGIRPSSVTVAMAHATVAIPSVLLLVGTRMLGLDPALEEAALDLGATWSRIIRRVYVPLMVPALLAGFAAAFVSSFNEFYLALYLAGPKVTLPVYFFSAFRNPNLLPPTLALNTLVTVVILALVIGFSLVQLVRARRKVPEMEVV
jgi:spermidine/putrescine transport system permease protein